MNIFKNFILHKTKKFDYKYPEWMNSFYTKRFHKNPSDYNKYLLIIECTGLIIQAKEKHIVKRSLNQILDNPNTAPETYWFIISRFLNKRKMRAIPTILADSKLVSDFKIKSELLILILLPSVLQAKMQVHYQSLIIELINV